MASPLWVILSLMTSMSPESKIVKLPRVCLPEHYELKIDLSNPDGLIAEVKGSVEIRINCVADSNNVTINWKRLFIAEEDVSVATFDQKKQLATSSYIKITKIYYKPDRDFLVINLGQTLKKGSKYILVINFRKIVGLEPAGLYKSFYYDSTEESKNWIMLTNLYPMNARTVFPCYDEPDLKATFNLTLIYSTFHNAFSNLKCVEDQCIGYKSDTSSCRKFASQFPIAPYQLAFSINDYGEMEETDSVSPIIEGFTYNRFEELNIAVNYTVALLESFCDLLEVRYPVEKLTLITVSAQSWEYSGGIGLLGVPDVVEDTELINLQLARGLLRQILTTQLTLQSWTELWIVEGLTWYFSHEALEEKYPAAFDRCLELSRYERLNSTLALLTNSSTETISSVEDLGQKGFCIFSSLASNIGESNFLRSVRQLMESFENKTFGFNAISGSFNSTQSKTNDLNKSIESWLTLSGESILNISRNGTPTTHYQMSIGSYNQSSCRPLRVIFNETSYLLNCSKPIVINSTTVPTNFSEFHQYQVLYDTQTYDSIAKELVATNKFPTYTRVRLVHDVLDFAWMGSINYTAALNLVSYLRNESDYRPWKAALFHFDRIWHLLRTDTRKNDFDKFLRMLISPIYQKLGVFKTFDKLSKDTKNLHALLARWTYRLNLDNCSNIVRNVPNGGIKVYDFLKEAVLSETLVVANGSDWSLPVGPNKIPFVDQKEMTILKALKVAEPHELMALVMDPSMKNPLANITLLDDVVFSSTSLNILLAWFGKANAAVKRTVVRSLAERIVSDVDYEILLRMAKRSENDSINSIFDDVLELVRSNMEWMKRRKEEFIGAIQKFKG